MATSLENRTKALSLVDIQALCDEAEQQGEVIYQQTNSESRFNLPQRFGKGGETEIRLRSGISLVIRDGELRRSIKLVQQMENPPSLLARQVGIDDCKLKWRFRQLFGTTVFGYLHDCRLERAYQLLATGQMSVTEVAHTIGYSSLSSFSKAFRKRFSSSPPQLHLE